MEKKQKRKQPLGAAVMFLSFLAIGGACGLLMVRYLDNIATAHSAPWQDMLALLALVGVMYVGIFLHIIVHEAGHLLFGLATGYRFCSFRIFSLMLLRTPQGLRLRRYQLAGTGGQCLMAPPPLVDGRIPVLWYNLGGSLVNLAVAALSLGASFVVRYPLAQLCLQLSAVIGTLLGLVNGIPLRMGAVDNDGYNAFSLGRHPDALRAFWVQLQANAALSEGVRLQDMPAQWFALPTDADLKNPMVVTLAVFACNRLLDAGDYASADAATAQLLHRDTGMVGVHRQLLGNDLLYLALLRGADAAQIEALRSKEYTKFARSMKTNPSILRTQYADALLGRGDTAAAEKVLQRFERVAAGYPYPAELVGERAMLAAARARHEALQKGQAGE